MIHFKRSVFFVSLLMVIMVFPASAGPLHKAVKSGDMEQVRKLIAEGKDVNEKKTFSKKTPLIYAVESKQFKIAKYLLKKGAKPDAANTLGDTALLIAAENGNLDILNLLLKNGADVNSTNNNGDTALLNATKKGRINAVEILLSYEAKTDVKNIDGETPSIAAASRGFKQIKQLLESSATNR